MRNRGRMWIVAALAILATSPASAGWEATEWGMSPEQVEAAMPNTRHVARGTTLDGKRVQSRGPYRLGEHDLQASYYYDDNGLGIVQLDVSPRDCNDALSLLVERYGNPLRTSDQVILRLVIWHDEPASTRVRALLSRSICSIYFERLADYRDHDLRNAAP